MKLLPMTTERYYYIRHGADAGLRLRVERTLEHTLFEWQREVVTNPEWEDYNGNVHPATKRWIPHRISGPKSIYYWTKSNARYYGVCIGKKDRQNVTRTFTLTEEELKQHYQVETIACEPWFRTPMDAMIFAQAMDAAMDD